MHIPLFKLPFWGISSLFSAIFSLTTIFYFFFLFFYPSSFVVEVCFSHALRVCVRVEVVTHTHQSSWICKSNEGDKGTFSSLWQVLSGSGTCERCTYNPSMVALARTLIGIDHPAKWPEVADVRIQRIVKSQLQGHNPVSYCYPYCIT